MDGGVLEGKIMPRSSDPYSFDRICTYDNFIGAYNEVAKGKRNKPAFIRFSLHKEEIIWETLFALRNFTWRHSQCIAKTIFEPKRRELTIPILKDRMLHHAVYRQIHEHFERYYFSGSFASREGKGQLRACQHLQKLYRRALGKWGKDFVVISIDLKSFFASIDHDVLKALLKRMIRDRRTLWLLHQIIDVMDTTPINGSAPPSGRGIAIGFVLSQDFGNYIASFIDHFVTSILGYPLYVRYMDDIRVLVHTRDEAKELLAAIDSLCTRKLKLVLSDKKTKIRTWQGKDVFCGYVVTPHRLMVKPATEKRIRRRKAKKFRLFRDGRISLKNICQSAESNRAYYAPTFATLPPLSRTKVME